MSEAETDEGYIRIPRKEYESMKSTIATLKDREVMKQLKSSFNEESRSLEDVKKDSQ
jgi:hypothetical protein